MSMTSRFLAAFRAGKVEREIEAEQEFHVTSRMDEYVADGMTPEEAARRARIEFGNRGRTREESRDAKLSVWLESAWQDLWYGFRTLARARSFAAVSILTLALGIGANTAIFSVVNGVLLNPLPYRNAERIDVLFQKMPNFDNGSISYLNFQDWQRMNRSFSRLAAYRSTNFDLIGRAAPEHLHGSMISAGFFEILGVNPVVGRTFTQEEDRRGANPVVIISEGLWKRKFGAEQNIVGQRLTISGVGRTVIGVIPSTFRLRMQNFQRDTPLNDIYTPIGEWNNPDFYTKRSWGWGTDAIGLRKAGVSLAQARADMKRVSRQLSEAYPEFDSNLQANLIPLKEEIVGNTRPVLLVLLGAVGLVLLIACVNVANLLLARSTARRREFSIRLAVGARQMRIVRQLLTESLLLALTGGVLGLILAKVGTSAALAAMPQTLPRAEEIGLDWRVLSFTALVSVVAGLIFGLAPALETRRSDLAGALKEGGRSVMGSRGRAQSIFVVAEVALALILLVGAGLMVRTLFVLLGLDPGFDPRGVMTFDISPSSALKDESPAAIRAFYRQVHDRLASAAGVESVSLSWAAEPMAGDSEEPFWIVGRPKPVRIFDLPMALSYLVEPEYLKTLRLPLERGRFLNSGDDGHAARVVVIDEAFAQKYFPGQDPIGQYLDLSNDPEVTQKSPNPRIVGVVRHVNQWGLDADAASPLQAQMYLPVAQTQDADAKDMARWAGVYVRGQQNVMPSFAVLRQRLEQGKSELVAFGAKPMQQVVLETIASKRFSMTLLAAFAALALLLASIGIYGVLSYLVGQRTQEIGVRIALGAGRLNVLRMILKDGARMTLTGVGSGTIAALGLMQLMSSMLFGVKPTDPLTFVVVAFALCSIALLACYIPARRAMKLDPMIALHHE